MDDGAWYDLVIVGATAGGLSVAISSQRSGISRVRVLERGRAAAFPELVPENQLDVGFGETPRSIDVDNGDLVVVTDRHAYRTRGVFIAEREPDPQWAPPIPVADHPRVHVDDFPIDPEDEDVLVVGHTDHAVELLAQAAGAGARVVLAAAALDPTKLSPAAEHMVRRFERDRRATILYRATPSHITDRGDYPTAWFDDRRTPDLEFDQIVFASTRRRPAAVLETVAPAAAATGRVVLLGEPAEGLDGMPTAAGWEAGNVVARACFPDLDVAPAPSPLQRLRHHDAAVDELRAEHYNATITQFEPTHSDLWVLRVRPDHGDTSHVPGQYASLGLGFWEQRIDDAEDPGLDRRWNKLIRRSYSISHPIFDDHGYLARQADSDELEFYITLVPPTDDHVPALTPRLALKRAGDRIYLGPKVAGRYTLKSVIDPEAAVIFLSTGTGEAPHNAMITELFHKGHVGPIVSAVTVRRWSDLGYLVQHRRLAERFANYHYVPMPTREPDVPKRYIQDLIRDGDLDELTGGRFDPATAQVFLCGNPAMIGLPDDSNGDLVFPQPTGVAELLVERGFRLDRRGEPGNVHFEEYW